MSKKLIEVGKVTFSSIDPPTTFHCISQLLIFIAILLLNIIIYFLLCVTLVSSTSTSFSLILFYFHIFALLTAQQ